MNEADEVPLRRTLPSAFGHQLGQHVAEVELRFA
jgi:hypothetical protein